VFVFLELFSGPTTPNFVLGFTFVEVVVPFFTLSGPFVPVVPVESTADAPLTEITHRESVTVKNLRSRLELGRKVPRLTATHLSLVDLDRSHLPSERVLYGENMDKPLVGLANPLSLFSSQKLSFSLPNAL
jgi:hypothetical protein